jgi:hypothetical protein
MLRLGSRPCCASHRGIARRVNEEAQFRTSRPCFGVELVIAPTKAG